MIDPRIFLSVILYEIFEGMLEVSIGTLHQHAARIACVQVLIAEVDTLPVH